MARIWSCGFELQSATNGVEIEGQGGTGISINTTTKKSGSASMRIVRSGTAGTSYVFQQFGSLLKAYARIWIYIATAPSASTSILEFTETGTQTTVASIYLNTDRTLQAKYRNNVPAQTNVGSPSSAIPLNEWHCIEFYVDVTTDAGVVTARLDGSQFASQTGITDMSNENNAWGRVYWGIDAGAWGGSEVATADLYFDDIAVNDTTGTTQNSWPGITGKIVHMHPNAAGDNTAVWQNVTDTGALAPSATGAVSNQWTNPTNAYSSDNSYATEDTSGQKQDYGNFNVPSLTGKSILGIQIRVEAKRNFDTTCQVSVDLSYDGGTNWTSVKSTGNLGITDSYHTLGGSNDLWGRTWAAGEFVNGTFLARISASNISLGAMSVDHVELTVYYADGAASYADIAEVTPDDATTKATIVYANDIFDVNCEASSTPGIGASDTITLVQVGIRENIASAATATWQLRIKSQASGTVLAGIATSHNDTAYETNGDALPHVYTLTSYVDPQAGGAWTPTLLDAMQIGVIATDATPNINVSTLWALVEYVPAAGGGGGQTDWPKFQNRGFWSWDFS